MSLTVAPPLGQYDDTKVINLGANRWSVKSELGLAHAIGRWVIELMGGVWLFTDNHDFLGGKTRAQDPIASAQFHATYVIRRNMWLAGDTNFYRGGRTERRGAAEFRFAAQLAGGRDVHHGIDATPVGSRVREPGGVHDDRR